MLLSLISVSKRKADLGLGANARCGLETQQLQNLPSLFRISFSSFGLCVGFLLRLRLSLRKQLCHAPSVTHNYVTHCRLHDWEEAKDELEVASPIPEISRGYTEAETNGQELSSQLNQQPSLDKTAATKPSTCGIPSSQSGLRNCVRMSASMPFHLGISGESEQILKRRIAF